MQAHHLEAMRPRIDRKMEAEEWTAFQPYIAGFQPQDQYDIENAYRVGEAAHRGQTRRSGERYFNHPRECAIILVEAGVNWSQPIILALLHDVAEDTDFLDRAQGPSRNPVFRSWDRIAGAYDAETASMLEDLRQQDDQSDDDYIQGFQDSDTNVLLVKMADGIHNARTLSAMPVEKQRAKIKFMRNKSIPIFQRAVEEYPEVGGRLMAQLQAALSVEEAEL